MRSIAMIVPATANSVTVRIIFRFNCYLRRPGRAFFAFLTAGCFSSSPRPGGTDLEPRAGVNRPNLRRRSAEILSDLLALKDETRIAILANASWQKVLAANDNCLTVDYEAYYARWVEWMLAVRSTPSS
jgi:hypothetical protein